MTAVRELKPSDVREIVAATFPEYRRKKVMLRTAESITLHQLSWDDGSRNVYRACRLLDTDNGYAATKENLTPYKEDAVIDLPVGFCVVMGGTFLGKQATLHVYVNPADANRVLGLGHDEKAALERQMDELFKSGLATKFENEVIRLTEVYGTLDGADDQAAIALIAAKNVLGGSR